MSAAPFSSRTLSIADLLSQPCLLMVPAFQRPFAWTVSEAGQLLDDLATAAGLDGPEGRQEHYFLGTILLLERRPDAGLAPACDIIDGQQRLATLTILIAALRDLLEGGPDDLVARLGRAIQAPPGTDPAQARSRLALGPRDQGFMATYVQAPRACMEMPDGELTPTEGAMLVVREHFVAELSRLSVADRRRLAAYLLDACHLVVIQSDDIDRAHRMFVVLNDRGRPLLREDILKADMGSGLTLDEADAVFRRWDAVAVKLGAHFEDLFAHIRTLHGKHRPHIITAIRDIVAERGGALAFIEKDLEPLGDTLASVLDPWSEASDLSPAGRRSLVYLNRLNGAEWVPAVMLALRQRAQDPMRAEELVAEIDRLAHVLRLLCQGSAKRQRRFQQIVELIASGAAIARDTGPFELSRDELRTLHYNLRDIHQRAPSMCKLLLMRLDDEISGLLPSHDPADFSVEHVLPVRPSARSLWREVIPDPAERNACTHSLGNLVLLTQKQNDRARNEEFSRKVEIYLTPETGRPILALTRQVVAATTWTAGDIRRREAQLLGRLFAMWRLEPPSAASAPAREAADTKSRPAEPHPVA